MTRTPKSILESNAVVLNLFASADR